MAMTTALIEALKVEWKKETFELNVAQEVLSEVKLTLPNGLMFYIGTHCPLAVVFTSSGQLVAQAKFQGDQLVMEKVSSRSPDWRALIKTAVKFSKENKSRIVFK